jgi:hypothetical protein
VLPRLAEPSKISDAAPFLEVFSRLSGSDAVAVMRAAHQYADALWLCDADPRTSWIKLFGALEAAADRWDYETLQSVEAQLQRRHPGMYEQLSRKAPGAIPIVAKSLSRILGAESKMIDFVLAHAPKPPARRPEIGQLDFDDLEPVLRVLYDHRSRDLHGGVPFPQPLSTELNVANRTTRGRACGAGAASADSLRSWPTTSAGAAVATHFSMSSAPGRRGLGRRDEASGQA